MVDTMKKALLITLFSISLRLPFAQIQQAIRFNTEYKDISLGKPAGLLYKLQLSKEGVYQGAVLQQGIDIILTLTDKKGTKILNKDSPNGQINKVAQEYGDQHEKELWTAFKNDLCNERANNWLYDYDVKDKPADLGYYIGYKITHVKNKEYVIVYG